MFRSKGKNKGWQKAALVVLVIILSIGLLLPSFMTFFGQI